MSAQQPEPTEEELRAALEEEMRRVTADQVLLQTIVSLVNLAGRRIGLAPGSEGERDLGQVRTAIEAIRVLLPIVEGAPDAPDLAPIRNALSQLQMAYAQEAGGAGAAQAPAGEPEAPGDQPPAPAPAGEQPGSGDGGPAQRSGRLWVPGQ
jgi:hypothetical protein